MCLVSVCRRSSRRGAIRRPPPPFLIAVPKRAVDEENPVPHVHTPACNHAFAKEGAVFSAAEKGDVPALVAALAAGGSTEEGNTGRPARGPGPFASFALRGEPVRRTPLWIAAGNGHVKAVRILLAAGANASFQDRVSARMGLVCTSRWD